MTIELRKPGAVEQAAPGGGKRIAVHLAAVRFRARAATRRHAWTAWRVTRQLPTLAVLLVAYSPRGVGRLVAGWVRYLRDEESAALRTQNAAAAAAGDYVKVSAVRSSNLAARLLASGLAVLGVVVLVLAWVAPDVLGVVVGAGVFYGVVRAVPRRDLDALLGAAAAGVAAYFATPWAASYLPVPPMWLWWLLCTGAVVVCGWVGRPRAKPLVMLPGVEGGRVLPLTAPMVMAALVALGNAKMKEPDSIRLLTDPHRHGPGMQVDLELPPGVPATYVMEHREELAAALRRELGTVWPSVGRRHPGHLALYIADQPMNQARQAPWPLLREGQVDLFRPVPLVTDQMGRWVEVTIAYSNGVIGAIPRQGKTFFLRELLLVAGLDPRARVYAVDGKGTGDLSPCSAFAHYIGVGDEPEDIEEQLQAMRDLRTELRRRARVIRSLPRDEAPESKVTSALADRRDLGLDPIVVGVDETQVWFQYGDKGNKEHKAIRDEFASITTDLVKRGPALGIWVFLATQQVNADTIPTSISNNAVLRFCLKVFGHTANDQVLGTGARKAGVDATMFSTDDKGIGYLRADGADALIGRTVFGLDAVASEEVAERARAIRAAAGRLTGQAADEAPVAPVLDIAADAERAMRERGRGVAHLAQLVEWLAEQRPDYETLDVGELGKRLRNAGVEVRRQLKVDGVNAAGVRLSDLQKHDGEGEGEVVYLDGDQ